MTSVEVEAKITTLQEIRRRAKEAYVPDYYRKLYACKQIMAGNATAVEKVMAGLDVEGEQAHSDLPLFPDTNSEFGTVGVQNHVLISSRINIQSIVYSDPEFEFVTDLPAMKDVNAGYIRKVWVDGDWGSIWYEIGMDVETMGVGFAEFGIDGGIPVAVRRDPSDMLWDPINRSPSTWRYYFSRSRLSITDLKEKYGNLLNSEDIERVKEYVTIQSASDYSNASSTTGKEGVQEIVYEWSYWDATTHCIFLGSIGDIQKSIVVSYDGMLNWVKGKPGFNPFGLIPVAVWHDSWAPGVFRPVGKCETTFRTSAMLNMVEAYMREIMRRGVPLTIISTQTLEPDLVTKLQNVKNLSEIEALITTASGNLEGVMHRVNATEIPQTIVLLRNFMKDELNAATGVMDSQRGEALPGEKTATEITMLSSGQGVQARHTRRRFARFLQDSVKIVRAIAALYGSKPMVFYTRTGAFDTTIHSLKPFLSYEMSVLVHENSLAYESYEEKFRKRMEEYSLLDKEAISLGLGDPYKIFTDIYRRLGVDPATRLFSEDKLKQLSTSLNDEGQGGQPADEMQIPPELLSDPSKFNKLASIIGL